MDKLSQSPEPVCVMQETPSNNIDRLSELPEPLLLIIISHLPFKEAARNSILSKLWRRLGLLTQNVEFNERFFVNFEAALLDRELQGLAFFEFVYHWIENIQEEESSILAEHHHYGNVRPAPVDKFALTFSEPEIYPEFVMDCIEFCVERNVKQLALDLSHPIWDELGFDYHDPHVGLSIDVYTRLDLESLALFSCSFDPYLLGNFEMLKHISLGWVALPVSVQETLLAQCRMLESLSLKKCWDMERLDVRGNGLKLKLKTLVVDRCGIVHPRTLYLEAPELRYFKFFGWYFPALTIGQGSELNFFEELDLDLSLVIHNEFSPASPNSIIAVLPPTRTLTVCAYTLRVIINRTVEEPIIPSPSLKVTRLTLKTTMHDHEQFGIKFFLNCCPNLETLTIERCPEETAEYNGYTPCVLEPQEEMWKGNVEVYECIMGTLRIVEVRDYMGSQHELDLLSYLLTHGRIMEQLTVITSSDEEVNGGNPEEFRLKAQEFLHQVEAASQNLEITVL
ncbi:hypothetical protein ACFX2G_003883 [Malus domestica]